MSNLSEAQYYSDNDFSKYQGMWVAISGKKILAADHDFGIVADKVEKIAGDKKVLFVPVPIKGQLYI
jgi:hypothetical protein